MYPSRFGCMRNSQPANGHILKRLIVLQRGITGRSLIIMLASNVLITSRSSRCFGLFVIASFLLAEASVPLSDDLIAVDERSQPLASIDLSGETSQLQHMCVLDAMSSHSSAAATTVLVAGVNRLWRMAGSDLHVLEQVETGPQPDNSDQCLATGCLPDVPTVLTDNHNKVLVVDADNDSLIFCGSVYQGACSRYRLTNLTASSEKLPQAVAANDDHSTTVAFIGPQRYDRFNGGPVLYVATTFTLTGVFRSSVPALATRRLNDLELKEQSITRYSRLTIDVKYRDHFLVDYIYGFNTSSHVYFLTVQPVSPLPGHHHTEYVTRIARVCITDADYNSYVEMTVQCDGASLLRAAHLAPAGANLQRDRRHMRDSGHVLVAAFGASDGTSRQPRADSGSRICVLPVATIEQMFDANIERCFNGSQHHRNLDYMSGRVFNGKCSQQESRGVVRDFCSVGLKLSAETPLVQTAALQLRRRVTSISTSTTGRHTVALLGTDDGQLIKVLLESVMRATVFSRATVGHNTTLLADSTIDSHGHTYYALTPHKVLKLPVATCDQYTNCSACLGSRNPYCGWCAMESRCSLERECSKSRHYASQWLTFDGDQQCIHIDLVEPASIALSRPAEVTLRVNGLSTLSSDNGQYQCVFGNAPPVAAVATRHTNSLRCTVPPAHLRPFIDLTSDHVRVPLVLHSSLTGGALASATFVYYECARHGNSCAGCVTSQWPCQWCVLDGVCQQNGSQCLSAGQHHIAPSREAKALSSAELGCPSVVRRQQQPIRVPNGVATVITVEMTNLPPMLLAGSSARPTGSDNLMCVTEIDGQSISVSATVRSSRFIVCDQHQYEYAANVSTWPVSVSVVWRGGRLLAAAEAELYKCHQLATHGADQDCSLCFSHSDTYRCSWCDGECVSVDQCRAASLTPTCPQPVITKIYPTSGPAEGGTEITIEGYNMGRSRDDVTGSVTVAGVPCHVIEYNVSVRIVCRTAAAAGGGGGGGGGEDEVEGEGGGVVRRGYVTLATKTGPVSSSQLYTYLRVAVMGVYPTYGPISGGTHLTLVGRHLSSGSRLTVTLDRWPCHVLTRSVANVTCVTSPAAPSGGMVSQLAVRLDAANRSTFTTFTYRPDPVLFDIRPLKSYMSGGRLLTIHGEHLDSVQSPRLFVYNQSAHQPLNTTTCRLISNRLMECPTPQLLGAAPHWHATPAEERDAAPIARSQGKITRTAAWHQVSSPSVMATNNNNIYVKVGFLMDNVEAVQQVERYFPNVPSTLMYVPDPIVFPFAGRGKVLVDRTLVIEGRDLTSAADLGEVRVTVGDQPCNLTSMTDTQVTCHPPLQPPSSTAHAASHAASPHATAVSSDLVRVYIGSLQFTLGTLVYDQPSAFPVNASVVGGIAGGSLLLLSLAVLTLLLYRRKSSLVEREYKRIQIQMDTLENNIRSECKQSFAAMCTWDPQRGRDPTTMTPSSMAAMVCPDLRTQLNNMMNQFCAEEVACVEQREFLRKVLFPGVSEHPIFSPDHYSGSGSGSSCDGYGFEGDSLKQLDELLRCHQFVDIFVDTLESQKDFNVRDRVTVASLLSVILMNDMEYMTLVLEMLLKKHIGRQAASKHPHLLLRRTETVVGKLLTNWISLCLYNYIQVRLAPSLHLLTRAVKCQMDAGPVDAVCQDAQYSIAEDRLLHEHVDFSPVTLLVTADELPYEQVSGYGGSMTTHSHYHTTYHHHQLPQQPPPPPPPPPPQQQYYEDLVHRATVHVLGCDTVSQAKQKIIGQVFSSVPASVRPGHHSFSLVWQRGDGQRLVLSDEDSSTKSDGGWRRLNTLQHYGIINIATVSLIHNRDPLSLSSYLPSSGSSGVSVPSSSISPVSSGNIYVRPGCEPRVFHLIRPPTSPDIFARKNGTVPEVFLTRQLSNKAMLQLFIDNAMTTLFTVDDHFPAVIKWLFDLLDQQAAEHGVEDTEVVHSWKSNCVPLRLWANLVRRPELIFDMMTKAPPVEASLAVISQSLVEACLPTPAAITENSAAYRLLFAKDVARWRHLVAECFAKIGQLPTAAGDQLPQQLRQLSHQLASCQFRSGAALRELHVYVTKYGQQLLRQLVVPPTAAAPPPAAADPAAEAQLSMHQQLLVVLSCT